MGSGKGNLAKLALKDMEFTFLSYGDLLIPSLKIYESPRQKLFRFFEDSIVKKRAIILGHLEEFVEEPGLWLSLVKPYGWFYRLKSAKLPVICTINSTSKIFPLIKDHFLNIFQIPMNTSNSLRRADLIEIKRDTLEKMIREGRTCAQLSSGNLSTANINIDLALSNNSMPSRNDFGIKLDEFYGLDQNIKTTLLSHASFSYGLKSARGALLSGPPGTGKTRLALALASTLGKDTRLIVLSSADLLRSEVGTSEKKLREAFNLARASQPALIFFDEVDSLFPKNPQIHLQTLLHQLIAEFDSLERDQIFNGTPCKVFVLAATNYLEKIENRLLQYGRLELHFKINLPTAEQRHEILSKDLLRKDDTTIDWNSFSSKFLDELSIKTEGCSPADLTKIVQDARKNCWARVNINTDYLLKEIDFT